MVQRFVDLILFLLDWGRKDDEKTDSGKRRQSGGRVYRNRQSGVAWYR